MIKHIRRQFKNNHLTNKNIFFYAHIIKNQLGYLKNIKIILFTLIITLKIHLFRTIY